MFERKFCCFWLNLVFVVFEMYLTIKFVGRAKDISSNDKLILVVLVFLPASLIGILHFRYLREFVSRMPQLLFSGFDNALGRVLATF